MKGLPHLSVNYPAVVEVIIPKTVQRSDEGLPDQHGVEVLLPLPVQYSDKKVSLLYLSSKLYFPNLTRKVLKFYCTSLYLTRMALKFSFPYLSCMVLKFYFSHLTSMALKFYFPYLSSSVEVLLPLRVQHGDKDLPFLPV
jgi:hypothetical protein